MITKYEERYCYGHDYEEYQGQRNQEGDNDPQIGGLMNLSESNDLDNENPEKSYETTNQGDKIQNLSRLRVGYDPETGLKAVFPPSHGEQ